jgi:hypothetical protein
MQKHRIIPIRLDPLTANTVSITTLITGALISWHLAKHLPGYQPFQGIDILFFILGVPALIAFHEAVHAAAWMCFGGLPLKAFEFGIIWRGIMPYCHCKEPLTVRIYRYGAVMPLVLTVPVFITLLLLKPTWWTALLASLSLSGCLGDVWLFKKLAAMKRDDLVLDCPDEAGCDVMVKDDEQTV